MKLLKTACRSGHPISINFNDNQTSKSYSVALSISARKLHLTLLLLLTLQFKSEICKYLKNPADSWVALVPMPLFSAEDGWLVDSEVFIVSLFNLSCSFPLQPLCSSLPQHFATTMTGWTPGLHGFWQRSIDAWKWQLCRAGLKWMIELSDWLKMCCGLEDLTACIHSGNGRERERAFWQGMCLFVFVCALKKTAGEMQPTPRATRSSSFLSSASPQKLQIFSVIPSKS